MTASSSSAKKTPQHVFEPIDPTYPEANYTLSSIMSAKGLVNKAQVAISLYSNSRLGRGLARYWIARGPLLAGGITYVALFSITGALTLIITAVMTLMGHNPQLRMSVYEAINKTIPGVLKLDKNGPGLISPNLLVMDSVWSVTGFVGLVVLLFSAARLMSALKLSIRSMFGIERPPISPVSDKLRDLVGLAVLLIGVVVTGIFSTINSSVGTMLLHSVGISGRLGQGIIALGTTVLAALSDALVLYVLIRVVATVRVARKDAIGGLVIGLVLSAVVRYAGTSAVKAVNSPILASFAALVTLLLWVNLLARLLLIVSAFMANPPRSALPVSREHVHADHHPNYVTLSDPTTLAWPHHRITGAIDLDWQTNPNRPARAPQRRNYRGGPIASLLLRRAARLERRKQRILRALRR